jgi:membrane protease YdiL (CAAX protease family)
MLSNRLTSFFFYCVWVDIALIYLVFYMFGFMGRGLSHDILSIFVMTLIVLIPTLIWKNKTKINKFKFVKKEVIFTGVCLLFWLGINIFSVVTLKGACLCYYNDNYGITLGDEQGPYLSTEWTRSSNIDQICRDE